MNASPSSPPLSPTTRSTAEVVNSPKRNLGLWRPIFSCGGAIIIGAVLVHLAPPTSTKSSTPDLASIPAIIPITLSASQIVTAQLISQTPNGNTLRGKWNLTTDTMGRARASGEVARWVVEPGAHVNAGDKVVEISTGLASRSAPVVETGQNSAEREQVAAANGQTALSEKLSFAQQQLADAQQRVANAQAKVASTHTLVRRLLAGEKIPVEGASSPPKPRKISTANDSSPRLTREQRRAQEELVQCRNRAAQAKSELDDANKALAKAQKQVDATTGALSKAESDFKAEKTTADVLQNARTEADDAASLLKSAQTRADVAQRAYSSQQAKVTVGEGAVTLAQEVARKASATHLEPTPQAIATDSPRYLTADQAATLVGTALRESKAATREADRIHTRVDDYQRQVRQTSKRVETASKDLQNAQQGVLDSVPRAVFVSSRAPVTGTITWISRLAREVGAGQAVFGISQGRSGFLRFEDKTGAWKSLRVGQTLNAASAPEKTPADISASSSGSPAIPPGTSPAMPASTSPKPQGSPPTLPISLAPAPTFSVRITRIAPPAKEGEAAQIDAVRSDGSAPIEAGANSIQAELPPDVVPISAPSAYNGSVMVPLSVVMPRDGSSFVAVIATEPQDAHEMVLQWRAVQIERQSPFGVEIKSGLHEGEKVVDQPQLLLSQLKPEDKTALPVLVQAVD